MPAAAVSLLLLVAALRGGSYLPVRWGLEELTLVQVVALEVCVAGLTMALVLAVARQLPGFLAEVRRRPALALRLAALQTLAPFALIALGLQHVPTGTASVLVCAAPLFATAIAGAVEPTDRPTRVQGLGLAVGLAGVALVVGLETLSSLEQALGALALLGAALAYVLAGLTVRRHYAGVPVVTTAGVGIVPALPLVLPVALLGAPDAVPGARVVGSLLALGVLCIALALVAFYALQRRVGPVRALLVTYLNPIVAVLLGVAFLSESLTLPILGGMALIVVGVGLATRPDPRHAARTPAAPEHGVLAAA